MTSFYPARVHIQAVVFDYGEVLSERADPVHMDNMARISGIGVDRVRELYWQFRDEYDRGTFDGRSYWRAIAGSERRDLPEELIAELVREDVLSWSRLRAPMMDWMRALRRADVKTAVLSNMMVDLLEHIREEFEWLSGFSNQTYSCELGVIKPEDAIFQSCLAGLGLPAGSVLFIDDREVNIRAAEAAGMQGIVFSTMEQLRVDAGKFANLPLP